MDEFNKPKAPIGVVLLSILVSALVFGGGVYAYQNNQAKKDKDALQSQITDLNKKVADTEKSLADAQATTSTTTTTPATINETANWKTYTNNKYAYSIKYPTDWMILFQEENPKVTSQESSTFNLANFNLTLPIYNFQAGQMMIYMLSEKTTTCDISGAGLKNTKAITIAGVQGLQYNGNDQGATDEGGVDNRLVSLFSKNGTCYNLSLSPANPGTELLAKYNQVVLTLSLVK